MNKIMENISKDTLFKNMNLIEQFVEDVVSYSSRYNNKRSIFYAPENLKGKPTMYPCYGDFPDTYILRSYGKWWNKSESAQKDYMPQDISPIISEDYVILKFEQYVIATSVKIYEIYNPGAVVRIWGGNDHGKWSLLWEGAPQICDNNPRVFSPPLRITGELIRLLRIDFNQSLLKYHTALDAVLLVGRGSRSMILNRCLIKGVFNTKHYNQKQLFERNDDTVPSPFASLPHEIIVYIFQYLDLRSLCSCAQVNRNFRAASNDNALYQQLSFKRYCHQVTDRTLKYFIHKCTLIRKLDMSWCIQLKERSFVRFLSVCGRNLTHLSLGNCSFVQYEALECISKCDKLIDLRLRNCEQRNLYGFLMLRNLTKLQALDLYATNIDDQSLAIILESNSDLKHLNLDLCELINLDFIAVVLSKNNRKLRTLSCWKIHLLTSDGVKFISKCPELRELDLGWCLSSNDPSDCLNHVAQSCSHLIRLIVSCWRGLVDHQLLPVIRYCNKLKHLDLSGAPNISGEICEAILKTLPDLELLDISFCDSVHRRQVIAWRQEFPHITIQRSYESHSREHRNRH